MKAGARVRRRLRHCIQTFLSLPEFFISEADAGAPSSSPKSPLHYCDFLKKVFLVKKQAHAYESVSPSASASWHLFYTSDFLLYDKIQAHELVIEITFTRHGISF